MERKDHRVRRSSRDRVVPCVERADTQGHVDADGLAGGAHFALRRRHKNLSHAREPSLQRLQALRMDAVIVGDKNSFHDPRGPL